VRCDATCTKEDKKNKTTAKPWDAADGVQFFGFCLDWILLLLLRVMSSVFPVLLFSRDLCFDFLSPGRLL
jgi:hypothetical protein